MRKIIQKKRGKAPVPRRQTSVSVSEESRTFTVVVSGGSQPKKIHVDAEPFVKILKRRCDYAVEVIHDSQKQVFFFVKLKGGDVLKAAEQLACTAEHLDDYKHLLDYRPFAIRHACIVASYIRVPTTRFQCYIARVERCGFEKLIRRTHRLIARIDEGGNVSYA